MCYNNLGIHEIKDFEVNCKSSRALRGFGFAEMPPVMNGGKGEAKRRPLTSGVVNNHWNVTEIKDFERSVPFTARRALETLLVSLRKKG